MTALFDIAQEYEAAEPETVPPTFKECAAADIGTVFFNENEHASWHDVDGKRMLAILVESDLRMHRSHWEAGAKQNFDTGLYEAHDTLYVQIKDYGPKPKQGKVLVLDGKRHYTIKKCEDEDGIYRITIERIRQ